MCNVPHHETISRVISKVYKSKMCHFPYTNEDVYTLGDLIKYDDHKMHEGTTAGKRTRKNK